jgi:hypothetical protein
MAWHGVAWCSTGRHTVGMQGVRDGGFSIGWGVRHRDETYCSDFQSYYCPGYMEMHAFLRAYCRA